MKCPKCGRFSKEVEISNEDGSWSIYSDCSHCGKILIGKRKIKTTSDFTRKIDIVKVLLTILIIILVGISAYINNSLNKREEALEKVQMQYLNLHNNYLSVLNTTTVLENYYNELQDMYNTIRSEYSDLENRYSILESEYSELLNEKFFLQEELNEILSFNKSMVLENNTILKIPAGGNTSITYATKYAGYIRVNFTSSTDIYFWIGSSITENIFYARYPSFPNTSNNGTFTVPVCCLTYVHIKNPDEEIEANILLSIQYVY